MTATYRRSLQQDVIENGVLPDPKENPMTPTIEIEYEPVSQAPFDRDTMRSRQDTNVEWAARLYAPRFGITPDGAESIIALLHSTRDMLGPDASPTEVYRAMRDTLAARPAAEDTMLRDAWDEACEAWRNGVIISA